jgi:hypothetical protein
MLGKHNLEGTEILDFASVYAGSSGPSGSVLVEASLSPQQIQFDPRLQLDLAAWTAVQLGKKIP